jgi:uncharacterized protein YkwD
MHTMLRQRLRRLPVLTLLMTLSACGGGGDGGSTGSGTSQTTGSTSTSSAVLPLEQSCNVTGLAEAMLAAVNQARATGRNCGTTYYPAVADLAWSTQLAQAAAGHSTDMATNNYFSHTSLDGRTFAQRIAAAGYAGTSLAENIAAGADGVDAVMSQWLDSPGHCANIMSASFHDFGAACASSATSTYGTYWTQDFGSP